MDWVEELRASLLRAGDHIAEDVPTSNWASEEGDHYAFRLWHVLPPGAGSAITAYIKGFAKEQGWKILKVQHRKFTIEFVAVPEL